VLGFVPGLPEVELDPDVVLAIFLQLVLAAQREALLLDLEEARLEV
jgi:hypothetical protein